MNLKSFNTVFQSISSSPLVKLFEYSFFESVDDAVTGHFYFKPHVPLIYIRMILFIHPLV